MISFVIKGTAVKLLLLLIFTLSMSDDTEDGVETLHFLNTFRLLWSPNHFTLSVFHYLHPVS